MLVDRAPDVPARRFSQFPLIRPHSPIAEPFIKRDLAHLGRRRPSRAGRLPRQTPSHPPETHVTRSDVSRIVRLDDTGPGFLDGVH
jgi:hypothetical protein